MSSPLERDRSPVAAASTACSCRNPLKTADCIRTRCAPGRRALRTPASSRTQGALKVRSVLSPGERAGVGERFTRKDQGSSDLFVFGFLVWELIRVSAFELRNLSSVLPRSFHRGADGAQNDLRIEAERRIFYIIQIVFELVQRVFGARAVGIIDLRPARQPRFHQVSLIVKRNFARQFLHKLGPFR